MIDPVKIWRAVKPFVPPEMQKYAAVPYRAYIRALCWYHEQRTDPPGPDGLPLPPASLRHRVIGVADARSFSESIPKVRDDFARSLQRVGRSIDEFRSVLDFGCGCGRGLRAFANRGAELAGSDIDAEAVRWCQAHLPFARWETNGEHPPLAFATASFDLIYSISVFTHLDEQHQFEWLAELQRVARPGAILLLTVHGAAAYRNLPANVREYIDREGFLYLPTFVDKGRFPDWYQNAYHSETYVRKTFGNYFKVLDYQPTAIYGQDLVIVERTS